MKFVMFTHKRALPFAPTCFQGILLSMMWPTICVCGTLRAQTLVARLASNRGCEALLGTLPSPESLCSQAFLIPLLRPCEADTWATHTSINASTHLWQVAYFFGQVWGPQRWVEFKWFAFTFAWQWKLYAGLQLNPVWFVGSFEFELYGIESKYNTF